jgi:cytochrome c biogenesis protein CcmG/thiol:disulfide interchange protein DsbE
VHPGVDQRTWAGAIGELWRSALRHKLASAFVVLCVAGSLAGIALVTSVRPGVAADPDAPAFGLPVLGHPGQRVSLADYAGRPLIVNFFASWCAPCQQETPLLARFYRSEHGEIALIGLDENDVLSHALSFTRAAGITYVVGWDPTFTAASAYGVGGLPQTFFLDARHRIVDRIFGPVTLAELRAGIALATGTPG